MKIAVAYSSKTGLKQEYERRAGHQVPPEPEEDMFAEGDSMDTIRSVIDALHRGGHEATGLEADHQLTDTLDRLRPELVFNIAEGLFGDFRESYAPMICERLGIPYTGSGPLTLGICLNKARAKEILAYHHISTPPFQMFYLGQSIDVSRLLYPAIIKPVAEGSSKGIYNDSVVDDAVAARERIAAKLALYKQPVIVESFITGDEFTVAVWGNGDRIEVLPVVAIQYKDLPEGARPLYGYEAKWIWDTPEKPLEIFQCPARITPSVKQQIQSTVIAAWHALDIRDWCRMDVRLDADGVPNILEVNPLPGILPNPEDNSCFPKAARTAGYTYQEMLNHIIEIASERIGQKEAAHALADRV
jgi:D-alanine-D-alanine ligase